MVCHTSEAGVFESKHLGHHVVVPGAGDYAGAGASMTTDTRNRQIKNPDKTKADAGQIYLGLVCVLAVGYVLLIDPSPSGIGGYPP